MAELESTRMRRLSKIITPAVMSDLNAQYYLVQLPDRWAVNRATFAQMMSLVRQARVNGKIHGAEDKFILECLVKYGCFEYGMFKVYIYGRATTGKCGCRFENKHSNTVIICDECSKLDCHGANRPERTKK